MNRSAIDPPRLATSAGGVRRRQVISLTPLIDVVFILLVFFMLASSFLEWRTIALDAPASVSAGASVEGSLLVDVRTEGLRLSGEALSLDALVARVESRLAEKPDQRVLVRPAIGVTLQDAVQVLDRLSAAGAADISLIRGTKR